MKSINPFTLFLLVVLFFLPGCDLIGDIFEVGFWAAIILIIAVIALIIWLISSFRQTNSSDEL